MVMSTTNCKKLIGEIENCLNNGLHNFESKIDGAFSTLKFKTWLCKTNIVKKDGYHACHLLFLLVILPLLKFIAFAKSIGCSGLLLKMIPFIDSNKTRTIIGERFCIKSIARYFKPLNAVSLTFGPVFRFPPIIEPNLGHFAFLILGLGDPISAPRKRFNWLVLRQMASVPLRITIV